MPPDDARAAPAADGEAPAPGTHYRRGLGLRKEILEPLEGDYRGQLVRFARDHDFRFRAGDLRFLVAREFGFCYGVDRAVEYAYEARLRFPDRRLFLTGEIIHNPYVNRRLSDFGIRFLDEAADTEAKFREVGPEDVVLLPAFGVATYELEVLRRKGSILVDTTCGSVMNVWKNVDRYRRDGFTAVVHGKYSHEETKATVSRAGEYLVVLDMAEALEVCRYIEAGALEPGDSGGTRANGNGKRPCPAGMDRDAFLDRFGPACSPGFDPDRALGRIGLANQTTMLASESLEIAAVLRDALTRRYGEAELASRFRSFDTICSATQERQDAVIEMLEEDLDLVLVIGGFNSSNTAHLTEICAGTRPSYHIAGPECLISPDEIRVRRVAGGAEPEIQRGWLPEGPLRIGVTSGASTPDVVVHRTLVRLLGFRGLAEGDCSPDET